MSTITEKRELVDAADAEPSAIRRKVELKDKEVVAAEYKAAVAAAKEKEKAKADAEFRNYTDSERQALVEKTYRDMHINQTMDFVKSRRAKWLKFDHAEMTILEAIELLDGLVDDSDPDSSLPNSIHDFQTAERIRQKFPGEEYDWFHLTGLLHDIGKIVALWGEPQWAAVGDTFPLGCKFSDKIVFSEQMALNADAKNPTYTTELGIYKEKCGVNNLVMSWGHDEYMYEVLVKNGATLPPAALAMVRFHSFYPWHTGGAYMQFMGEGDEDLLKWVKVRSDACAPRARGARGAPRAPPTARVPLAHTRHLPRPFPPLPPTGVQPVRPVLKVGRRAGLRGAQALLPEPARQVRHRRQAQVVGGL
jgi:inositol oxygenase